MSSGVCKQHRRRPAFVIRLSRYIISRLATSKMGTCIKRLIWPPLEPKTKNCFSQISFDWFIRRITEVYNFGIFFKFYRFYGTTNSRLNRLKIEKLPFLTKFKVFRDREFEF